MTLEQLTDLMIQNNIPLNVRLMSDSGWECDATEMNGIWYHKKNNILVFTQGGKYEKEKYLEHDEGFGCFGYRKELGWKMIYCSED